MFDGYSAAVPTDIEAIVSLVKRAAAEECALRAARCRRSSCTYAHYRVNRACLDEFPAASRRILNASSRRK